VHFTIYMYLYLYSYRRETARQLRIYAQLTRCFSAVAELLVYNGIVQFLCHITAFLYRPISATVQMLKLQSVRWFSRPWRKITAIAENHGTRLKSQQKPRWSWIR